MAGGHRGRRMGARWTAPAWSAAIGIGALALVATACSGGTTASGGTATTAAAAAVPAVTAKLQTAVVQTDAANSVAVSLTATGVTNGTTSALATGSGSFDLTKDIGQMSLSSPALSSALGQSTSGSITVLSDGTDLYVNVPQLASLTGGKPWLELPITAAAAGSGAGAGSLSGGALGDPTKILSLLAQYGGTVTTVGPATVGGTPTTEYRADINLSQVAAAAPATARHPFTGTDRQGLQKLGITSVPVTVWVGTDGKLRQVQVTVDLSHATLPNLGAAAGTSASSTPAALPVVTETIGFTDYGLPVTVTPPPASQVTDLSQALLSLKSALPGLGSGAGPKG